MPTPVPFADDGGTPAWRARHASPPGTTFPDLAVPVRPRRAAVPAGVHGSGVLAGLDVVVFALLAVALVAGV